MATTLTHRNHDQPLGERVQHVISVSAARVAAVWQAAKNRREVNRLAEWDERMLRDIGLTRNDVTSALASKFGDDPSARLDRFAREQQEAMRALRRETEARRFSRTVR